MPSDLIDTGEGPSPAGRGPAGGRGDNLPEMSVSELSGRIKRSIEDAFGLVRVRGEIGRVSAPKSGHVYLDLKDDRAVLASVIWKGVAERLRVRPEEGMEVIATGRLTTFPGQSRYQLVIESLAPAGVGALMAMLEDRKRKLAAEGLFDEERKRPLPFLPEVIGVVTSPSGAVIRDILHRVAERFPRRVLVWPVAVQGERSAAEVAAAIRGFDAIAPGGAVPRPDVLIVARGGGSIEDLWSFNEEIVLRAAAACRIPLVSAVGHETDTTLLDHVADRRAPTPTAAAEMVTPVRAELVAALSALERRRGVAQARAMTERRGRLRDLARALPRPEDLTALARQRLDFSADKLPRALLAFVRGLDARLGRTAGRLAPGLLARRVEGAADRFGLFAARLAPALARSNERAAERYAALRASARAAAALTRVASLARDRLDKAGRLLETLSYKATLARGYAAVRGPAGLVARAADLPPATRIEIELTDGRVAAETLGPETPTSGARRGKKPADDQGSLF